MNLTPEQKAICDSDAATVFVSAAAGSGKTTLLVERYLRAILEDHEKGHRAAEGGDDEDGVRRMLGAPTVTFTRKAAAEMRKRIRSRLIELGRIRLAWRVDEAPIGTIHSLCSRLLRAHVLEAAVDPGFRVLDEEQAKILSFEAMESAWDGLVIEADGDQLDLLARFGAKLRRDIPVVWSDLRQTGVVHPSLGPPQMDDLEAARAALACTIVEVSNLLDGGAGLAGVALSNWERLLHCADWFPAATPTWDDIERTAGMVPSLNCAAAVKPAFKEFKSALLAFRESLGRHYLAGVHVLADRLLWAYHRAYQESKEGRGALDFADLEIAAAGLLGGRSRPPQDVAYLMVDEFQDTNSLQCSILDGLGAKAMLTVGDPYQSIYSFRGADVEVFQERRRAAEMAGRPAALAAALTVNFRSTPEVLSVINHIFGHEAWFGAGFPALAAPDPEAQVGGSPPPDLADAESSAVRAAVEVMVVDPEALSLDEECVEDGEVALSRTPGDQSVTRFATEAAAVAERVFGLLEEGWRKRDVVILLRAFTHVGDFEEALVARGIDTYVVQGRGFFHSEEVADLVELLNILVNPHDDRSLVATLRSPLLGLSDDVAYLLRCAADERGHRFLWETIRLGVPQSLSPDHREVLERFAATVDRLRTRLGSPGLASLIEAATEVFDYDLVVLRTADGRRRLANLRKLMRLADEFESVEGPDLGAFVDHVRRRGDLTGERESSAPTLSEEEDVVRVMTVHKAKGLEFPVVVVAGMGSAAGSRDGGLVRVSKDGASLRVVAKPTDLTLGPHDEISQARKEAAREEEMRLYYVACTRAESRLILSGLGKAGCVPLEESPLGRVLRALGDPETESGAPVRPPSTPELPVSVVGVRAAGAAPRRDAPVAQEASVLGLPVFPQNIGGRMRVGHVSYSALELFQRCPLAYYLERVLGLDPDLFAVSSGGWSARPPSEKEWGGEVARAVGTIVHRALEGAGPSGPLSVAEARTLVAQLASQEGFGLGPEPLDRAALLTSAFWDSSVPSWMSQGATTTERPFLFAHEGVSVSGYMDLVIEAEGEWTVVDYKTTRLHGRDPREDADRYALQAELYALACLLAGAESVRVAFLFLEAPLHPVLTTYLRSRLAGLQVGLSERLRVLRAGPVRREGPHCGECGMEGLCRIFGDDVGS